MNLRVIVYNSKEYKAMIELRMEVLRKPLGLTFSEADLQKEEADILIGVFSKDILIGCCILTKIDNHTVQLRQMAVTPAEQGKGIGTAIINFAEKTALKNKFTVLLMHARKKAVPFYLTCGYSMEGEEYVEVGIPHYTMVKKLR